MSNSSRPHPQSAPLTLGLLAADAIVVDQPGSLWSGVCHVTAQRDANLLCFVGNMLRDPQDFNDQANVIYDLVDPSRIDGLIIWASALGSYLVPEAVKAFCERYRPLPMVSIGTIVPGIPSIVLDSYQGMHAAVTHLIEAHHCQRLAFIRGPEDHHDARERYRGYLEALQEHGLPYEPDLISPPFKWGVRGGADAVDLWLDQRHTHFDAVVAVNDGFASGALRALREHGLRVPEDVALVGFSNEVVSRVVSPPLTTVPLRMYERGCLAAEMLLDMIAGKPVPEQVVLPTQLIVRESCGCAHPGILQAAAEFAPASLPARAHSLREFLETGQAGLIAKIQQSTDMIQGAQELVQALREHVGGAAPGQFLFVLENILRRTTEAGGEAADWQSALSILRKALLPYLVNDVPALLHFEDLWGQARVLVSEWARRSQAFLAWQANQQFGRLHRLGQALATALDVPGMMDALARELPRMGVRRCYLSLYEDAQQPARTARLYLAYDENGRAQLDAAGLAFSSLQLVPEAILPRAAIHNLIVEPLYFQQEQLGFILFSPGALTGNMYDLLRDQFGSALKRVLLHQQNVQLYRQALEAQAAAQQGQRSAEEADLLKSHFLSMVSHELLTPLVLLVGLSEMMLREGAGTRPPLPDPYRQDLARIHVSAQQLGSLVRDVMDLARSQLGQLKLAKRPVDLGEALKAVALVGEQLARNKGLEWRLDLPEKSPLVLADPTRLRQVALNLVTNAVKFTLQGYVRLAVEVQGQTVTISVSDSGPGVPTAEQEVIFDEFRQSERTTSRGYGGLGIGLAICRQLVELHGGQIGVRSSGEEESGSTFYFCLPTLPPAADTMVEPSPPPQASTQTVLLLTPVPDRAARLQEHLVQEGFRVEVAQLDEQTDWLQRVAAAPPGAVILDMPASESGWAWQAALKAHPVTQDIPVLYYSLSPGQDSGSMLAMDYAAKPLEAEALAQTLQRYGLSGDECREAQVILVVDDDPAILDMHSRMVQTCLPDCRVLTAANGRRALEVMRQERPALVLLDLMMPELDGLGVLEAMQASASLRGIPVIVLTAQSLTEQDMARLNQGVAAILNKGVFSLQETWTHIEQALARNRAVGNETQRMVRKAMAYIHEHYAEPISRETMAAHVCVSARHLTRCFNQEIGISPIAYLNRYRVQQAKRLLETGHKSVTEVAEAVGFSSGSYFTDAFRREVGVSPRDYARGQRAS